jgi:structural maintenance of chromosome 2
VAAKTKIKKLEKDMDEFKNNREGKTEELKVKSFLAIMSRTALIGLGDFILSQNAALQKQAVSVKTQHKEMQRATLELGSRI